MQTAPRELTYKTIEKEILRRITSGEYAPGQQLPTERELERELGVSRLTIAKGLANLAAAGYITRTQGRGSFVCTELPQPRQPGRAAGTGNGLIKYISPGSGKGPAVVSNGILEGVHAAVNPDGRHVCVEFYDSVEQQLAILKSCLDPINEGFVIWPALDPRLLPELRQMQEERFPFVLVDAFFPEFSCDYIISDNCLGAETMINHLYDCGHRRIAYFSATPDRVSLSERLSGVISGLSKKGLTVTGDTVNVIPGVDAVNASMKSAGNRDYLRTRLQALLNGPNAPTALFASNDCIAMALCNILEEIGVRVPEDVSVAGFDNIDAAQYFTVPLTTMAQNFYEIGRLAGKVLMSRRGKTSARDMLIQNRVPPTLIVRESISNLS